MFNVQYTFVNVTGLLCGLHECIENYSNPSYEEIKVALESSLPFRLSQCSAVYLNQTETEFLAAIIRSRINLAELPLPNAKSWLFGDDFPTLASNQAELSRGLMKKSGTKYIEILS